MNLIKSYKYILIALFLVFFVGCGNEDGKATSSSIPITTLTKGYLIDSPIKGVTYICENGDVRLTNKDGMFECTQAPITFKIGKLILGKLTAFTADGIVTPQDLLGLDRDNFDNPKLKLLARFLQSLDDDGDISTYINIKQNISNNFIEVQNFYNLKEPDIDFLLYDLGKVFVSEDYAINHLKENKCFLTSCNPINNNDYTKQICEKDGMTIKIYDNDCKSDNCSRWGDINNEEIVRWILEAQKKFKNVYSLTKHNNTLDINITKDINGVRYGAYVNNTNTINLNRKYNNFSKKEWKQHIEHEYFHHYQFYNTDNKIDSYTQTKQGSKGSKGYKRYTAWFMEGSANYVSGQRITKQPPIILESGLTNDTEEFYSDLKKQKTRNNIHYRQWSDNPYTRSYFFEMLNNKCSNFNKTFFKAYFEKIKYEDMQDDKSGIKAVQKVLTEMNCDFGNQLGDDKKSSLDSALLFYQYATAYKNNIYLLTGKEKNNITFARAEELNSSNFNSKVIDMTKKNKPKDSGIPAYGAYSIIINKNIFDKIHKSQLIELNITANKPLTISIVRSGERNDTSLYRINKQPHIYYNTKKQKSFKLTRDEEYFITLLNPTDSHIILKEFTFSLKEKSNLEKFNDALLQYVKNKEKNDNTLIRIQEPFYSSKDNITLGDLDGDGEDEWVITYGWDGTQGVHAQTAYLLIFKKTDDGFKLLVEEPVDLGIYRTRIEEQKLIVNQSVYLDGDPICCPSGDTEKTYSIQWDGETKKWNLIEETENIVDTDRLSEDRIIMVSKRTGNWDIFSSGINGANIINLTNNEAKDNFPDLTKDRRTIVFVSNRDNRDQEIYSMNINGTHLKRLTYSRGEDITPKASPDGKKIVFLSKRDGNYNIYTMDINGNNQTRLTDTKKNESVPSWSPTSNEIVFVSERDGNKEIYIMDSNGENQERLTNNSARDNMPTFSPDGTQISFLSNRDGDFDLWIMNIDGTNAHKITSDNKDEIGWYAWSPDGSRIVYDSKVDGDYEIYSINPDGSDLKKLTDNNFTDQFSSWSWDGNKIIFMTDRDGNMEVYSMDANGNNQINISNNSAEEALPSISPIYGTGGGCFIATAAYGSYLASEVMVLRDFRDNYLLTNSIGKALVEFYYATSPSIADYIAERPILRGVIRICLTPIVYGVKYGYITLILFFIFIFWRVGLFRKTK